MELWLITMANSCPLQLVLLSNACGRLKRSASVLTEVCSVYQFMMDEISVSHFPFGAWPCRLSIKRVSLRLVSFQAASRCTSLIYAFIILQNLHPSLYLFLWLIDSRFYVIGFVSFDLFGMRYLPESMDKLLRAK